MNLSTIVPENPRERGGSPSFWFGLQTATGTGALIQPILAWGQTYGDGWGIFHEVFDWNNEKDSRSPEAYQVQPGDVLHQSVRYIAANNSYSMYIASEQLGKSISWSYALEKKQTVAETTAYIVVEHAPPGLPNLSCNKLPASNNITFSNIVIEVAGKAVPSPHWTTAQESPACKSQAVLVGPGAVQLKWSSHPMA